MLEGRAGPVRATPRAGSGGDTDIDVEVPLIDPLKRIASVDVHYVRSQIHGGGASGRHVNWSPLPGAVSVGLRLDGRRAVGTFTLPARDRDQPLGIQAS